MRPKTEGIDDSVEITMTIPAWSVITWPKVLATVNELEGAIARMQHLSTSVHADPLSSDRLCGQVLWGGDIGGTPVGIAWDWTMLSSEVVAMADPMKVLTNLVLMECDGELLDDMSSIVRLNTAIHELGWQGRMPTPSRRVAQRLAA
jgi:hypothetical protein